MKRRPSVGTTAGTVNRALDDTAYDIVKIVSDQIAHVTAVSTSIDNVDWVATHATELLSLVTDKLTLDSLFADKATLDSLFADKITLDSLYADKTKLDTLYTNLSVLQSLHTDLAKLTSIYNDKIKLDSIYADKSKLDSLATDLPALQSLYADKGTLDSLFADKATLDSLFGDKTKLDVLHTNITKLLTVHDALGDINNYSDTYHGSLATAPTIGSHPTLSGGDFYFDSGLKELRVYDGSIWKSAGSTVNGVDRSEQFVVGTASGSYDGVSKTIFPIASGYDAGFAVVIWNGDVLADSDIDISSGTQVEIISDQVPIDTDIIKVIAFGSFVLADHYSKAEQDAIDAIQDAAITSVQTIANAAIPTTEKGAISGVAQLDANQKLVDAQIPTKLVPSDISGTTGGVQVTNIMTITQTAYDLITPDATTVYIIVG